MFGRIKTPNSLDRLERILRIRLLAFRDLKTGSNNDKAFKRLTVPSLPKDSRSMVVIPDKVMTRELQHREISKIMRSYVTYIHMYIHLPRVFREIERRISESIHRRNWKNARISEVTLNYTHTGRI